MSDLPLKTIYIEKEAYLYPEVEKILQDHPHARQFSIDHYKDVFNRPLQNFQAQKASTTLVIAVSKNKKLYQGVERINSFGNDIAYLHYVTQLRNCPYNCDYCFLQGMHNSSALVLFVNFEDFKKEVLEKVRKMGYLYLSISYHSDVVALEGIYPLVSQWFEVLEKEPRLEIEVRMKGAYHPLFARSKSLPNMVLVWSLSPDDVTRRYENACASLAERIFALSRALQDGWRVRLCFDPILYLPEWKDLYGELFKNVFHRVSAKDVEGVNFGFLRFAPDHLRLIRRMRKDSDILYYPLEKDIFSGGEMTYSRSLKEEMYVFVQKSLESYIERKKIFYVEG